MNIGREGSSDRVRANTGGSVALALLALECVLIFKYARNTAALVRRARRPSASFDGHSTRRSSRLSISGLTHEQLQYRTRYTTKRFAAHAQYWQFVVRFCSFTSQCEPFESLHELKAPCILHHIVMTSFSITR